MSMYEARSASNARKRPRISAGPGDAHAQDGRRAPRKLKVLTWTDQFSIHIGGKWTGSPQVEGQGKVEGEKCGNDFGTRPLAPDPFLESAPCPAQRGSDWQPSACCDGARGPRAKGADAAEAECGIRPALAPCLETTPYPARSPQENRLLLRRRGKEMTVTNGVEASTVLSKCRDKGKERGKESSHGGQGAFLGLDLQHGPSHSDHMEEKMRHSGYWEMRNEKLKEQGAALRVGADAGTRAMASVYRNLAKRFRGADGEEREETDCTGSEGEKMLPGGGSEKKIEAKAVSSWETSCGHIVKLARPKAEVADYDAFVNRWQVRVSGPSILEADGFKKMTCKANVDDALKKAAKYLKISVDDLQPKRAKDVPISDGKCEKKAECDSTGRGCLAETTDSAIFHGKDLYFDGRTGSHSALHLSKLVMLYGGSVSVTLSKRSSSLAFVRGDYSGRTCARPSFPFDSPSF